MFCKNSCNNYGCSVYPASLLITMGGTDVNKDLHAGTRLKLPIPGDREIKVTRDFCSKHGSVRMTFGCQPACIEVT